MHGLKRYVVPLIIAVAFPLSCKSKKEDPTYTRAPVSLLESCPPLPEYSFFRKYEPQIKTIKIPEQPREENLSLSPLESFKKLSYRRFQLREYYEEPCLQEQHSEEVNLSALKDLGKLVLRKIIWNSDYPAVKSIRSIGTRIGSTASYPLDLLLPEMKTHFDISFSKRKKKLKISKSSDNLELGIIFEKDSGEQRYSFFLSLPF